MTDQPDLPEGLADLPLEVRKEREREQFRETQEGLARAHVQTAEGGRARLAHELGRAIRAFGTGQG